METDSLSQLIAQHLNRTATSRTLVCETRPTLADALAPIKFHPDFKEICYPIIAARCQGSRFWDADANEFVDFCMGLGSALFGHNPQFLKSALLEQIESGFAVGLTWAQAGEVAKLVCQLTGMERAAFMCSGAEAVMIALRLARTATSRQCIALFSDSYHGQYDGTQAAIDPSTSSPYAVPAAPGIPRGSLEDLLILPYCADESLQIIYDHREDLAAILVEPLQTRRPDLDPRAFLHQLRELTKQFDIALIFDELITGFRLALGGAQASFGVRADLAIYGKVLGGGLPIGIVAGKRRFMDPIDGGVWSFGDDSQPYALETFISSTFAKHPLSLAAARATLRRLLEAGPSLQEDLNRKTSHLVASFNQCLEKQDLPLRFGKCGSYFGPTNPRDSYSPAIPLIHYHLISHGIYLYGASGFLSTTHSQLDLDRLCQRFCEIVLRLKPADFLLPQIVEPHMLFQHFRGVGKILRDVARH